MYLLMAILSVYGINGTLQVFNPQKGIKNSVLTLPLVFGLYYFYKYTYPKRSRRNLAFSCLFAFPLSLALIYGNALSVSSENLITFNHIIMSITLLPLIQCVLLKLQDLNISKWEQKIKMNYSSKKISCLIFVTILGVWVIHLLSMMPGYWGYDSAWQFNSFKNHNITTHHPIIHTYLLCGLLEIGKKYFGSYENGMLIYSVFQMLILDYALTKLIKFSLQYSKIISIFIWFCCAFLPYNAILSFSGTKDVIFAALFVLWILLLIQGVTISGAWKTDYVIKLIALTFLMCAFRNNGIYVFISTVPFWIAICKNNWKKVVFITICSLGIWTIYTGPIYDMLKIGKGSVHEMLSIPCQQLSAVYVSDGNLCGEEERILEYIPTAENYNPRIADNVKNRFNDSLFLANKIDFFKLWFKVGLKNPGIYINAFANTNIGFWYPDMIYSDPKAWHPYIEYILAPDDERMNPNICMQLKQFSYLPKLTAINQRFCRNGSFQQIPIISMLCSAGFYFWVILAESFLLLSKKNYRYLLGIVPAVMYWGTCILGPVVLLRYAYPYMLVALMMLAPALMQKGEQ